MAAGFKDHFSGVSNSYADFRPAYPAELLSWLAGIAPGRSLVWDCAAGTGQASVGLAEHFDRVIATDASAEQVQAAKHHPKIEYRVALAENSGLPEHSVDLVTVAQALHWFDLERFYAEVRRVMKPGGILAVWTYGLHAADHMEINRLMQHFYAETVGLYWPPERKLVESGYRTLHFPFEEIQPPQFSMQAAWNLWQLAGYLRSWSATSRFIKDKGYDPVDALEQELRPFWGPPDILRTITWPLSLRVGR